MEHVDLGEAGWSVVASRDLLREAKRSLLAEGLLASPPALRRLPEHIERSWRRSVSLGVSPDTDQLVDPVEREPDERLLAAARPVLASLAEDVADMAVAVVLSDANGRIIERIALDSRQRAALDRIGVAVGADFAEQTVGTNGLGSVIEERAPLFVRGAEHFIDVLEEVACAGVPVFDPITRRVRGSLSLTCRARIANPLMLNLTHAAVRDIEQRLIDGRRRGLLDIATAFAEATSRSSGAIAMLTPKTVLANTAGLPYVSAANHATVWNRLVSDGVQQPAVLQVELSERQVEVRAQRVEVADEQLAFQVSFSPLPASRPEALLANRWHPLRNVHDDLVALSDTAGVLVLAGESGTGKSTAARRVLAATSDRFVEVDLAADDADQSWMDAVVEAQHSGGAVLMRHLDALADAELSRMRDAIVVMASAGVPTQIVLTVNRSRASAALRELLEQHANVVELPELAAMRSAIPQIVQAMVLQRPRAERCMISAAAMQALSNREWPGNFSELQRVVLGLLGRHAGSMVTLADLPESLQTGGRNLSPLERAERATIVQALREADGNRAAAARILGIGRTTLYRKLQSLRIEDGELTP